MLLVSQVLFEEAVSHHGLLINCALLLVVRVCSHNNRLMILHDLYDFRTLISSCVYTITLGHHCWITASVLPTCNIQELIGSIERRHTLLGNALAVPVACAAVTGGAVVLGTAGACLTTLGAFKAVTFGFGLAKRAVRC